MSKLPYWALLGAMLCTAGFIVIDGRSSVEPQDLGLFIVVAIVLTCAAWLIKKLRGG